MKAQKKRASTLPGTHLVELPIVPLLLLVVVLAPRPDKAALVHYVLLEQAAVGEVDLVVRVQRVEDQVDGERVREPELFRLAVRMAVLRRTAAEFIDSLALEWR
jgi:hypothetical protein